MGGERATNLLLLIPPTHFVCRVRFTYDLNKKNIVVVYYRINFIHTKSEGKIIHTCGTETKWNLEKIVWWCDLIVTYRAYLDLIVIC